MYSFVESDDRVNTVLKFIDDALKELEDMDGNITSYKIHLNVGNWARVSGLTKVLCRLSPKIFHLFSLRIVAYKYKLKTKGPFSKSLKI